LHKRLDWQHVLRRAQRNRIAPSLHQELERAPARDLVPPEVRQELRRRYYLTGLQNALFCDELKSILRAFRQEGVDAVLLKGMALAETVWRNVALRPMADIDLLVREEDLDAADEILSSLGHVASERYRSKEWYRRSHHHLAPRYNQEQGIAVELHRNIVVPDDHFSVDISGVWQRAQYVTVAGVDTRVLSPEDQIIHLCLHVSHDDPFVGKIGSLMDIAQAVRHYGDSIRWNWIRAQAVQNNFGRFVYYPLYLAKDEFGVAIPGSVLDRLKSESGLSRLEDRLLRSIIKRCMLHQEEAASLLPDWVLRTLCEELLRQESTRKKTESFLRALTGHDPGQEGVSLLEAGDSFAPTCCTSVGILRKSMKLAHVLLRTALRKVNLAITS